MPIADGTSWSDEDQTSEDWKEDSMAGDIKDAIYFQDALGEDETNILSDTTRSSSPDPISSPELPIPIISQQNTANSGYNEWDPDRYVFPKSRDFGYLPPLPKSDEQDAVNVLRHVLRRERTSSGKPSRDDGDFVEFDLTNFSVYLPNRKHHAYELRSLVDLGSYRAHTTFLFDGILKVGKVRRYVESVPFEICSLGNYGTQHHEIGQEIWIQSTINSGTDIFYRLRSPAPEYRRFHTGFLWVANLAKHFVDYSERAMEKRKEVSVHDFRERFSKWIRKVHKGSTGFKSWYESYQSDDFRNAVAVNISFLFKESVGVNEKLRHLVIWKELLEKNFVPFQKLHTDRTIVTPYVYHCFEHMRFSDHLKQVTPTSPYLGKSLFLNTTPEFSVRTITTPEVEISSSLQHARARRQRIEAIKVGDVISVSKDTEGSAWKNEPSRHRVTDHDCWYIYVHDIHFSQNGNRSFGGIWLYPPSDTCCAKMKYPHEYELFLSNNCTCHNGRYQEKEILDVVDIWWHGKPGRRLFVRQTYLDNERFVTLKAEHKKCAHKQNRAVSHFEYPIGQTVLVKSPPKNLKYGLHPCEIVNYVRENSKNFVILRSLLRRSEIEPHGCKAPNELVYTDKTCKVETDKIDRICLVRFYSEEDLKSRAIPPPYNRDGTGDAFIITTRLVEDNNDHLLQHIFEDLPQTLIQGFDPRETPSRTMLRGLDLFCGGGNFGRGLEEGGAVHNSYAVDYANAQIHTYYANLKDPSVTKLFHGSVDCLLLQALKGNPKRSPLVPSPGEIDFISAGSPCQGFSSLNMDKNNAKGLKNQSLVASVAAYVDFYRPKYGILENVLTMAQKGRSRDEDVLSQLICCLVGMGYQLDLFVVDAWSTGSPQSRGRLFLAFAAAGLTPLEHPGLSHSHPQSKQNRGLGVLSNGQAFGQRLRGPTPFNFRSAGDAVSDLPKIGDGRTYQCTACPDHIMPIRITQELALQIEAIPIQPRGSNFVSAWNRGRGVMTKQQRALFPFMTKSGGIRLNVDKGSRAWGRVDPSELFSTVVVASTAADARMGTILHWEEPRTITIMESRRAQSFPDEEVLVGTAAERMKTIGNSVSRSVALSLGLSLRRAWLKNLPDDVVNKIQRDLTSCPLESFKPKVSLKRSHFTLEEGTSSSEKIKSPRLYSNSSRVTSSSSARVVLEQRQAREQLALSGSSRPVEMDTRNGLNKDGYNTCCPFNDSESDDSEDELAMAFLPKLLNDGKAALLNVHEQHHTYGRATIPSALGSIASCIDLTSDYEDVQHATKNDAASCSSGSQKPRRYMHHNFNQTAMFPATLQTSIPKSTHQSSFKHASVQDLPEEKPRPKYVPVDNSSFVAYAMTHEAMGFGKLRKHGPKST